MEKQRIKDYKKVIDNNKLICSIYNHLAQLDIQGKKNSEEYNNLVGIIKKYKLINERLVNRYSFYDEGLNTYMKYLKVDRNYGNVSINDEDDVVSKSIDIDTTKNLRFVEHIISQGLLSEEYNKNELYDGNSYVIIGDQYVDRQNAIGVLEELEDITSEEAEERIDDYFDEAIEEQEVDYTYKMRELDIQKAIDYYQNAYCLHTLMHYIKLNGNKENNDKVKNYLKTYEYKMISTYKALEDAFLNNPNNYLRAKGFKKVLQDYYNSDSRSEFFDGWDFYYMQLFEEATFLLSRLENAKKINPIGATRNIIIKSSLQTYASTIFEEENVEYLDNYRENIKNRLAKYSSHKIIDGSKELTKSLMLSQK